MKIDMNNAHTYSVIPHPASYRTGVLILAAASYPVSWGKSDAKGPHMRINEPDAEANSNGFPYYACELSVFLNDYSDVVGMPGVYIKKVTILARTLKEDTVIDTLEGPMSAPAGSYVAQDGKGNQWPISPKTFEKTYVEA